MFPRGNKADFLSLYLDAFSSQDLPFQWSRYASFKIILHSSVDAKLNIVKGEPCAFCFLESGSNFHGNFIITHHRPFVVGHVMLPLERHVLL